jgi:hypothetical protein
MDLYFAKNVIGITIIQQQRSNHAIATKRAILIDAGRITGDGQMILPMTLG